MSDPNPTPETIDLARADDPRDVVHRAVALLAGGGVIGLPTGTGYALAASALKPEATARIASALDGPAASGADRPWICLRGPGELLDWAPAAPVGARRAGAGPDGAIVLCCPDHPFVEHLTRLLSGPPALAQPIGPQGASAAGLAGLDAPRLLIDDGPPDVPAGPTILGFDGQAMTVLRPGPLDDRTLARLCSTIVLFVCTGNTCRSPMAEALFKAMLAQRLGCPVEGLEPRGWLVLSAGLSAMPGAPAAAHAAEVVRAFGGSLDGHASRMLSPELVRAADRILVMTAAHLDALLHHAPEAAGRARLLDPEGVDLDDPVGSDLPTYRATAEAIRRHLVPLLDELVPRPE